MSGHAAAFEAAVRIVRGFLFELCPGMSREEMDHNARAILARLAHHEPPILLCYPEEIRESAEEKPAEELVVDVLFVGSSVADVWGPFSSQERAENVVVALAAREDVRRAKVREETR